MSVLREGKLPEVMPSQDPDRKEVLIISGMQVEGSVKNLRLFEMIRSQEGKLVGLREAIPGKDEPDEADVPLLDAFINGFRTGVRNKAN